MGDIDRMNEMLEAIQAKVTEDPPAARLRCSSSFGRATS
jgi:hypothetical protein